MKYLLPQSIQDKLPTAEVDYGITTPEGKVHEYPTIRNSSTGAEMIRLPTPGGRRVRRRLREVLREGVDVRYEKCVVGIEYVEEGCLYVLL